MEFPHLGKHCSEPTCNRLDFLPVNCDSCEKTFCSTHYNYDQHKCPNAGRKDKQVPVCPLCGEPVPTAPGVEPDLTVGQHIDQQCKSDTRKIFTNRCNYKTCKRKELIPVTCSQCNLNFCLRHRHFADHECKGSTSNTASTAQPQKPEYFSIFRKANSNQEKQRSLAGNAAERRRTATPPNTLFNSRSGTSAVGRQRVAANHLQTVQGDMTEDEALARALALSIMELDENADRNRRDEVQSRTTAQTPVPVGGRENSSKDKCSLS